MSYLGAAEVLDQARHQLAPASWRVFRAQASYYRGSALFYLFTALILSFVAAVLAFVFMSLPSSVDELLALCPTIPLGTGILWLIWLAGLQFRESRRIDDRVPPKRIDWRIPDQFRTLAVIAQTIIEAQTRFKVEHANQS